MNTYNEISHKREMERLEQAILNHHVHIGAIKQESVIMQAVVDTIEIYDQRLLALILEFAISTMKNMHQHNH